jgi:hypothetical protein
MFKTRIIRHLLAVAISTLTIAGIQSAFADAYTWTQISTAALPGGGNYRVAMSSDGAVILIGRDSDGAYLSTNYGASFSKINSITNGKYTVAVSADGNRMFASVFSASVSDIFISNDRGSTWTNKTGFTNQEASCMSGDGSVWMIGGSGGSRISTDYGSSWASMASIASGTEWWSCALSYDGTKRFFLPWNAAMRYSTNSGTSWSVSGNVYSDAYGIAASTDGSKIYQISRNGNKIYKSTNFGATFTQVLGSSASLFSIATSGDGQIVLAGTTNSKILISRDYGVTWAAESTPTDGDWISIAISSNGARAIGVRQSTAGSFMALMPQPATLTLQSLSPNSSPLIYRSAYTVTIASNSDGKVTFFANGKKITKCSQVATVSMVATCIFTPSIHGVVNLSASITPSDSAFLASNSVFLRTSAVSRSTKR